MSRGYLDLSPEEFEKLCRRHIKNNKKIKALFNHSEYRREKIVHLLKAANEEYGRGFLDKEDEKYLEAKLRKLEINANDWCYKTKWVKEQLNKTKKPIAKQMSFKFSGHGNASSF